MRAASDLGAGEGDRWRQMGSLNPGNLRGVRRARAARLVAVQLRTAPQDRAASPCGLAGSREGAAPALTKDLLLIFSPEKFPLTGCAAGGRVMIRKEPRWRVLRGALLCALLTIIPAAAQEASPIRTMM